MPSEDSREKAGLLEAGLLLAALTFYAIGLPLCGNLFRPGFAIYDEESYLDQIQAWREGHPMILRFAWSSLYRALGIFLVSCGGPHLFLLRLPAQIAVLAEALLLYVWLRDKLGERCALWAALADLVCTATFARGASLLGCSVLPAAFLLAVLACERLKRPWQALLWGFLGSLVLLDYEGWTGALLFLCPYSFWIWRDRRAVWQAGGLGLALGLALVVSISPDMLSHIQARNSLSSPDAGFLRQAYTNTLGLLSWGDRLAISAAANHPWPAPWSWPLMLWGAAAALRRFPWLAWLLISGSAALGLVNTDYEPHRLCLALLALGAFAGMGATLLWQQPKWGRMLCVALLVYGSADEIHAWTHTPAAKLRLTYGSSVDLEQSARWLAQNQPAGGWDVISGLGSHDDGAFRLLLDQEGVRPKGKTPVALIYWDYRPGLRYLGVGKGAINVGTDRPLLLFLPQTADAEKLRHVRDSLLALRWIQISESLGVTTPFDAQWLQVSGNKDPWARTVVWEQWLFSSLLRRTVELGGVRQMLAEPLVCGWGPDILAKELAAKNPALALAFHKKAESIDPRRATMSFPDRIARY